MVKKKQRGGRAELIDYNEGGLSLGDSKGFIPFVENIEHLVFQQSHFPE